MIKCKERKEVGEKDCWNVEAMYVDWSTWERDFQKWGRPSQAVHWPELSSEQFSLMQVQDVKKVLDISVQIDRALTFLYTYAHLRHDEDVSEETAKKAYSSALGAFYSFREETSWIEPALLQLPQEVLNDFLLSDELQEYRILLRKMIRLKVHTLSASEEKLLALVGKALETSSRAFSVFNNADLKFLPCKDAQGKEHELTHSTYFLYLRSRDRNLRKEAFMHLHEAFGQYENTLAELMEGQVQKVVFQAKARKYSSCLESALYPNEVDPLVYTSLIQSARNGLPILHRYLAFRKKRLGYSELHLYDLNAPLVEEVEMQMPYEEAVQVILDSVAILGEEYVSILRKGLKEDRWVDRYENKRKRSGAYSSGCYDSMPYILMNYKGILQDVMTLTHEAGHSMHSYYSRMHQSYQDSSYSIFVAEVASTFHEELLFRTLVQRAKTKQEKAYLIHQKIDGIRATFFRQVLFAEFELQLYQWAEQGIPLTPALLKECYFQLNQEYFGKDVIIDQAAVWEWSRIPHFYSSFYVYQYATGISAACALARQVETGDAIARNRYLEFLSAGGSLPPLDVLRQSGVDMTKPEPVQALLTYFQELSVQLEKILEGE